MRIPALVTMMKTIEAPTLARRDILCIGTMMKRVLSAVFTITLACSLAACAGGSSSVSASNPPEQGNDTDTSQARLADSLQSLIDTLLEQKRKDMKTGGPYAPSKELIALLEQAQSEGSVSLSNYEKAWSNYRRCVVDRGQPQPKLIHYANGLYTKAGVSGGTQEQRDAFLQATDECEYSEVLALQTIYAAQIDNPNLYSSPNVGIVDCLQRHGLVPKDYTASQFQHESSSEEYSFDESQPQVQACYAANNRIQLDASDESVWQDLG